MLRKLALAAAVCVVASPAVADSTDGHWYLRGAGGPSWADDSEIGVDSPAISELESSWDNPGWAVDAAIGYDFGRLRLEWEAGYHTHDADTVSGVALVAPPAITFVPPAVPTPFSADADGDIESWSWMLNGAVDFPVPNIAWLTPYIGAGAGWSVTRGDIGGFEGGDNGFAWQAFAGTNIRLDGEGKWNATLAYRYYSVPEIEDSDAGFDFETDYTTHDLMIGVKYVFGIVPPPPAPAPQPVAQPAPAPKEYVVYFGFDEDFLTPAAKATVAEVAAAIKAGNVVTVRIVGHTDTVGSLEYNQGLSERRAAATKQGLIDEGVADSLITTEGKSWTQPAKDTGPGVREPLNRRAVITF